MSTSPSTFIQKVFEIFNDPKNSDMCGWNQSGQTIFVSKIEQFSRLVLPRYFRHSNFQSFVRQLNMYSFRKTIQDPRHGEFEHPNFKQAAPERLVYIKRKLNSNSPTLLRAKAAAAAAAAGENPPDVSSLMIPSKSASRRRQANAASNNTIPDGIASVPLANSGVATPSFVHGKGLRHSVASRSQSQSQQFINQSSMFKANGPEFVRDSRFHSDQFDVDADDVDDVDDFESCSVKNENGKRSCNESSQYSKRTMVEDGDLDIDLEMLMNMSVDDNLEDLNMDTIIDGVNDSDLDIDFSMLEDAHPIMMQRENINDNIQLAGSPSLRGGIYQNQDMSTMIRAMNMGRTNFSPSSPSLAHIQTVLRASPANDDFSELVHSLTPPVNAVSPLCHNTSNNNWSAEEIQMPRKDSFSARSVASDLLIGLSRSNSLEDWSSSLLDIDFDVPTEDEQSSNSNIGLPLTSVDV